MPREVVMIRTPSPTSWYASRSPVTTITGMLRSRAWVTSAAITSSASKPSTEMFRYPNASTSGRRCGHWSLSRSGRLLRWAL
jgi:hypothetical protein